MISLHEIRQESWQAGALWMLKRFLELPPSVRGAMDPKDAEIVSYMGRRISHYAGLHASDELDT